MRPTLLRRAVQTRPWCALLLPGAWFHVVVCVGSPLTPPLPLPGCLIQRCAHAQEYRLFLKHGDTTVSPWHDVPLYADASKGLFNFICEIPKETKAKVCQGSGGHSPRLHDR